MMLKTLLRAFSILISKSISLLLLTSFMSPFVVAADTQSATAAFGCSTEDMSDCSEAECEVVKISKLGKTYSIKPKKLLFKNGGSGNGKTYLSARLEAEKLVLLSISEPKAKYELYSSDFDLDVSGAKPLTQAVSRIESSKSEVITLEPYYSVTEKSKFKAKMSYITADLFSRGDTVKIDARVLCKYKTQAAKKN